MKKQFLLIIMLCFFTNVFAEPVRQVIFFGDSLTDNGNLYAASHQLIPKSPPYYLGRFSNGPVWADKVGEYLQNKYQIRSDNYAVGGATAILRRPREGALPYYLKKEVTNYLNLSSFPERLQTLYFFWIGGNDYMDEKKESPEELVNHVVNEIVLQIRSIITNGGKRFVIMDLPDFEKTPFGQASDQARRDRLSTLSELNHVVLKRAIDNLKREYPNFQFILLDIYSLFNDMLANIEVYNKKYGINIVNLSEACWQGGYTLSQKIAEKQAADVATHPSLKTILRSYSLQEVYSVGQLGGLGVAPCDNPDEFLFWDNVHPTTISHHVISQIIIEALESANVLL